MKITIIDIAHHRNGICGAPFTAVLFEDTGPEGSRKIGILFDQPHHCAVLDIAKLAQIGLEFTGMTAEEAAQFTSTVDWTSTLLVPIPKNAASYQQVPVDGVTGALIERPTDDAPQFALLWVKDGIIYTIGGLGDNSQKALEIANSLQ